MFDESKPAWRVEEGEHWSNKSANRSETCADYGKGWEQLDTAVSTSCYFFGGKVKSFDKAEYRCNKKGGWLVRINNAEENAMIFGRISKNTWTGLRLNNHTTMELEWTFETGVQTNYTNWETGEPDNHNGNERCVLIQKKNGKWNDQRCEKSLHYICEAPSDVCRSRRWNERLEHDDAACADYGKGWKQLNIAVSKSCYFFGGKVKSFDKAKYRCNEKGGWLVRINNAEENAMIFGRISQNTWTGLHIHNHTTMELEWTFETGVQTNYTNWETGEPDNHNGNERCVSIQKKNGKWNDQRCEKSLKYICEAPPAVCWNKRLEHHNASTILDGSKAGLISLLSTGVQSRVHVSEWDGDGGFTACADYGKGWEQLDTAVSTSCYFFGGKVKSFDKAEYRCNEKGGWLVRINNAEENAMIFGRISQNTWTGLHIHNHTTMELEWTFETGVQTNYTNWETGEPDNHNGNERCVSIQKKNGKWNDQRCEKSLKYICEAPPAVCWNKRLEHHNASTILDVSKAGLISLLSTGVQSRVHVSEWDGDGGFTACADYGKGWKQLNIAVSKSCYFFGGKVKSFDKAEYRCNKKGGWLIRINNAEENAMIFGRISKNTWTGLRIHNHTTMELEWTSGTGVQTNYTNWETGEPDNHNGNERCVSIQKKNGKWNDQRCEKSLKFICEAPPDVCSRRWNKRLEHDDSACADYGKGWKQLNIAVSKSCYFFGGKVKSFDKAEYRCNEKGGWLVRINNAEENAMIFGRISKNTWTGLRIHNHTTMELEWTSGTGVQTNYTNWETGEPDNHNGNERCVSIQKKNGKWNDQRCEKSLKFICEAPPDVCSRRWNKRLEHDDSACADYGKGWKQLNIAVSKSCYFFGGKVKSFDKAEYRCNEKGGWLVRINNAEENAMIFGRISKNTWTGLRIHNHTTMALEWTSKTGVQTNYTNWETGEPDNHNGNERCVSIQKKNGKWNDQRCEKSLKFICEAPPAVCSRRWEKRLEHDGAGTILEGNTVDLISELSMGVQIRVHVPEWGGDGGFTADVHNAQIINGDICAQSILNIGESNWNNFESDVYWRFIRICTNGNVHVSRWLIGSHDFVNETKTTIGAIWFTRELGCEKGDNAAVYTHDEGGTALCGTIQDLLDGLGNGYDVRSFAPSLGYSFPHQNMKWETTRAAGQNIWSLSQQNDAYWWFTMWSTSGNLDRSRWSVGEATSTGHSNQRMATNWVLDPCWALAYKHDNQGTAVEGSLDYLRDAVVKGHRVRVLMGAYSIEADGLTVRNGHVNAQLLASISRSGFESYADNVYWFWQVIATTGSVRTYRYRIGSNTNVGDSSGKTSIAWYIDTRYWKPVLSHTENGTVTHGSKLELVNAAQNGAMVRYALKFPGDQRVHVLQADNIAINGDDINAQSARSVSQSNVGTYEVALKSNPYWFFTLSSSTGTVAISRWTVGLHDSRGNSITNAAIDWFVNE
ncbi:hypothetical protein ScPMuIL_011509 [Solemya velum]